jgi:DNA-binding NtrC family response regulator
LIQSADDIPVLVWGFLEEFCARMGKRITKVPRRTMEALQRHSWPGNVRELRNMIEHAAIITEGDTLRISMLDEAVAVAEPPQTLADSERQIILRALERARWHIKGPQGAAAQLGLKPSTLYGRMKKLGIRPPRRTTARHSGPNTDSRTTSGPSVATSGSSGDTAAGDSIPYPPTT